MTEITIKDNKFPMLCTLEVLEKIQEKYGDLNTFSDKILPTTKNEDGETIIATHPDIVALLFALPLMITEGITAYNEDSSHKIKMEYVNKSELCRMIDIPIIEIALLIHREFWRSINAPKSQKPENMN